MALAIKLTERSFGGKKFRPDTQVFQDKESNLLMCITAWGSQDIAEKVAESIQNFIALANEDQDVTVPYARKENLHTMGNILRMAVIMASEKIYTQHNKDEYSAAFEIFAAIQDGPQWIYISCGQPSVVLYRKGMGAIPLCQSIDLNILTTQQQVHDPLPNQLLGLGQHPPINYGNVCIKATDKIALVSRTFLPNDFFRLEEDDFNQKEIATVLAKNDENIPFWLGFIGFD